MFQTMNSYRKQWLLLGRDIRRTLCDWGHHCWLLWSSWKFCTVIGNNGRMILEIILVPYGIIVNSTNLFQTTQAITATFSFFFKKNIHVFIWKSQLGREREKKERVNSFICWFTPQIVTIARSSQAKVRSQKLYLDLLQGWEHLCHLLLFCQAISWVLEGKLDQAGVDQLYHRISPCLSFLNTDIYFVENHEFPRAILLFLQGGFCFSVWNGIGKWFPLMLPAEEGHFQRSIL